MILPMAVQYRILNAFIKEKTDKNVSSYKIAGNLLRFCYSFFPFLFF